MSNLYSYNQGQTWGTFNSEGPVKSKHWNQIQLGSGFHLLGRVVRVSMRLLAMVLVTRIALHAWGLSMFDQAVAQGDLDRLDRYDKLDVLTAIFAGVLLLVAGITWMVWQYRLAKSAQPHELRRGPKWNAFAWITPIVGLWFPYQNVRDLWRRRFPDRSVAVLGWWWAGWVAILVMDRVMRTMDADNLDKFKNLVTLDIVYTVVGLVTLLLALWIHRVLSDAELNRSTPVPSPPSADWAPPAVNPEGTPAG